MYWEAEDVLSVVVVVVVAIVVSLALYWDYNLKKSQSEDVANSVLEASQMVNSKADELSKLIGPDGGFVRLDRMITNDPWNHPLAVVYSVTAEGVEELEVRSAGADGEFKTSDDIATQRWHMIEGN